MPLYLEKRPSGIYRVRGTHHGIAISRSTGTRSIREAEAVKEKFEREIFETVILGKKQTETFIQLARDYLTAGKTLGPRSEDIILYFSDRPLDQITPSDCDLLAARIYPDAKASTINRNIIAPISAIMNWAANNGRAPLRKWPRRRERQAVTDWRRPAEMEAILAAVPSPQARALVALHIGCGLRASEAVFLDGRDVAPDLSYIRVLGTVRPDDVDAVAKGYEGTKGFLDRRVPVPPRARVFIAPVISNEPGRALVNSRGLPWADRHALNSTLPRACEKAGFPPIRAHALRHTWATWNNAVMGDLRRLMDFGGWTDLSLVQRYAHCGDDSLRDEVLASGWVSRPLGVHPESINPENTKQNKGQSHG